MSKGKTPAAPAEPETPQPELFKDLEQLWNDWQTMSVARPSGMSPSGIPWSEWSTYARDHGYHGAERLRFCRLMSALDAAWLAEMFLRRERKRKGKSDGVNRTGDPGRLDQPSESGEGRGAGT